ncbi:ankyrin [Penicillium nucicola]|uniref:ankyrin n=1 Tax=Penicillium nucicola TaxID=1850975 RepID=UPI0025454A04|nr:ankyrin [Penicillium nucicola]KAJ5771162.1 ankyrin [Penicillium nucicola]
MRLSPNPPLPNHWSPLLWSAIRGDEDVTRLLLDIEDITVDIKYPNSRTPLSIAAEQGFVGVVRLLLAAGADPNTRDGVMNRSPLHWAGSPQLAGESRDLDQQNMFREDAQDPKCNLHCALAVYFEVDLLGSSLWMEREREPRDSIHFPQVKPMIQPNVTGSLWSAGTNYKEILDILLQYGASLELKDSQDRTPLLWAATCGYQQLVELLLDKALSYAAENGHYGTVQFLLEKATRRDSLWSDPGWAPLMWAAKGGHVEIVKLLLSVHTQRWPEQSLGSEAAQEAARYGKTDIIPLLVQAGARFEGSQTSQLMTPLHLAAMNMHVDTVKCLLDITEIDVNAPDRHGWTALDWATSGQMRAKIFSKHVRITDTLLEYGACPSSRTVEVLKNPPHFLCRDTSGCDFPNYTCNPISFRCDWNSIAQGRKMRDFSYEKKAIWKMGPALSAEVIKMFEGWSYNSPQLLLD